MPLLKHRSREQHKFHRTGYYRWEGIEDDALQLSRSVFDHTVDSGHFDALYSTRHFGILAFYLALNGGIPPLLNWFGGRGK